MPRLRALHSQLQISCHFKFFHNFSFNFAQNLANFLNFRAHNQKQSRIFNLFLLEFPRPFSDLCNAARSRASGWERSRAALWWRVPQSSGRGFCGFVNLQILKFSRVLNSAIYHRMYRKFSKPRLFKMLVKRLFIGFKLKNFLKMLKFGLCHCEDLRSVSVANPWQSIL